MIGFAVYTYEGVGVVLPVMEITARPDLYKHVLVAVMLTVVSSYLLFGELCYAVWGKDVATIVVSNLPTDSNFNNIFVAIIIILFCVNLVFTYPLVIYPANLCIENIIFKGWPKSKKR